MDTDVNQQETSYQKPIISSYKSPDEIPEELDPEKAKETFKNMLRQKRNNLLIETDLFMLPDYPITPENLIILKDYRQALRDFTDNNYILPEKPDFIITLN